MKFFLAICLMTTAMWVPVAAASNTVCAPGTSTCAGEGSYGGDCATAGTNGGNSAGVSTNDAGGYTAVGVQTYCYNYDFFGNTYTGAGISVYAVSFGSPAGTAFGQAGWNSFTFGTFSYCDTFAYAYTDATGFNGQNLGCPAGAPPTVPAVLP
ncbi:MAG TPA: hypothetical protein VM370_04245 [Candidatus Thermoplasmatota archaeon]|nr:hypothetical protein [Candidatus Thermoplasmatota archaeon]